MKRPIKVAVTGHRVLQERDEPMVAARIDALAQFAGTFISGACIGLDAFVAQYVEEHWPDRNNVIVVPSIRTHVCPDVLALNGQNTIFQWMPRGTHYRERNQAMVDMADRVEAFWCGNKRSGTWMTMNMARRAGKMTDENVTMIHSDYKRIP